MKDALSSRPREPRTTAPGRQVIGAVCFLLDAVSIGVLLSVSIYLVWNYGGTSAVHRVSGEKLLIFGCLLPGLARMLLRGPRTHTMWLLAPFALLAVQALFMAYNARTLYDPESRQFARLTQPLPGWPGTIDAFMTWEALQSLAALAAVAVVGANVAQSRGWRQFVWESLLVIGSSAMIFGLAQRIAGTPILIWEGMKIPKEAFGPFYYHGNAGAFMNLILPLALSAALLSIKRSGWGLRAAYHCTIALLCVASVFVCVSKASQAIALLILAAMTVDQVWRYRKEAARMHPVFKIAAVFALPAAVLLIALLSFSQLGGSKWEDLIEKAGSWKERVLGWETAYALIEKRPWAGHGPGTFLVNFQVQGLKHPNGYPVRWEQCHNDYLEMWIEWGLLGLIGAAGIALPALLQGLRVWLWARPSKFGGSDLHLARGLFFASLGVLLHAFVDFPLQIVTIRILATLMIAMLFCLPAWSCARSPE